MSIFGKKNSLKSISQPKMDVLEGISGVN